MAEIRIKDNESLDSALLPRCVREKLMKSPPYVAKRSLKQLVSASSNKLRQAYDSGCSN